MDIRTFEPADETAVIALWERCGLLRPWNDPHRDIARKRADSPELFLVGERAGVVVAAVMAGYEGHRGWVNYLAVDPTLQRQGLGRQLMAAVEARLLALGCPKINLQVRADNETAVAFYHRLGYRPDAVISLGKRLIPDH